MNVQGWQREGRILVPASGSALDSMTNTIIIENLCVWAVTGTRQVQSLVFQAQINGTDFGPPINIGATLAPLNRAVFCHASTGATPRPIFPAPQEDVDPFDFGISIVSTAPSDQEVTLYWCAVGNIGG